MILFEGCYGDNGGGEHVSGRKIPAEAPNGVTLKSVRCLSAKPSVSICDDAETSRQHALGWMVFLLRVQYGFLHAAYLVLLLGLEIILKCLKSIRWAVFREEFEIGFTQCVYRWIYAMRKTGRYRQP